MVLCLMIILSFAFVSACGKTDDETPSSDVEPTFESFEIVGEGKKTIEEKINEEIDIGEQITFDYKAEPDDYVYAVTKIKNPGGKRFLIRNSEIIKQHVKRNIISKNVSQPR